jgi:hypothetical protein
MSEVSVMDVDWLVRRTKTVKAEEPLDFWFYMVDETDLATPRNDQPVTVCGTCDSGPFEFLGCSIKRIWRGETPAYEMRGMRLRPGMWSIRVTGQSVAMTMIGPVLAIR